MNSRALFAAVSVLFLAASASAAPEKHRLDDWAGGGFALRRDHNSWSAQVDLGLRGRPVYLSVDGGSYRKRRDITLLLFDGAVPHDIRVHSSNRVAMTRFLLTYAHRVEGKPIILRLGAGIAVDYITSLRETRDRNVITGAETLFTTENNLTVVRPALSLGAAWRLAEFLELRLSGEYEPERSSLFPVIDTGGAIARLGLHARFP
ncbi:MAG: hypothetical protein V3S11_03195 [Elusimicrobiota bacterium]